VDYVVVKFLHILSSTFLFGTGVGTAFYLLFISRTRDPRTVAAVARLVVIADWIFTTTTIIFQPASGLYLAHRLGVPLTTPWLYWSIVLFVIAALCWLPVVWLQMRLRDMAQAAAEAGQPLPLRYDGYLGIWAALGVPALFSFLVIFYLMTAKPAFG
jgi:Predicted integral membrane protein